MARTISQAFDEFLARLTPTDTEIAEAASHRASIEACLKGNFNLNAFFRSGSFGNGTSIRSHSDLDYFAELSSTDIPQNSTSLLTKVKAALAAEFRSTDVCIRSPAVCLPFTSGVVEVTPAGYVRKTSKVFVLPHL